MSQLADLEVPGLVAAIVGGGQGTRLGGQDKALVQLAGQPQLQRLLAELRPQSAAQVLVSNRPAQVYAGFGLEIIADRRPDALGPLAGIEAALHHAAPEDVLCVPVDAVKLPPDLVRRLQQARRNSGAQAACVHDGAGLQSVCCLLSAELAASASRALDAGEYAVNRWLRTCGAATADFSDWPRWAWSFNTPQELQEARDRLNDT